MSDVSKLTDAELTRLVAEKVMGWKWGMYSARHRAIMERPTRSDTPSATSLNLVIKANLDTWRPLEDWNDCMAVVKAMREKGWHLFLCMQTTGTTAIRFEDRMGACMKMLFAEAGKEQRCVLEAALLAVGGSNEL